MKKVIKTEKAPQPIGPYNQAIEVNGILFVSGQIAIDPLTSQLVIETIEAETNQVMLNIKEVLSAAGYDLDQIVKTSIFLNNMDNFPVVNEVYASFFDDADDAPARETVEVSKLPKNVNVEISVIAAL